MASISSQRAPSLPLSLPSSSSSSSSEPRLNWDVFLNFCGEDTRYSFIDHLYDALKKKGIEAFRDDENLERGTYIAPELMKAITESKYAVTVLSENYAFSRWCLTELTKIVECMKESHGLTILPVFYKVDPSAVRNQTGTFAMAFAEHEKDVKISKEMIQRWKDALREVGNISGWPLQNRYESKVIQEIIGKIQGRLNRKILTVRKDLVGIDSRAKEVINIFDIGLDDVCFVGIWGMSGSGKTTLAKAVHDRICGQFQASSFIGHVREEAGNRGLVSLQKQLLYDILMEREVNICDIDGGMNEIVSRLRNMKVLIILDDVDEDRQLKALVGSLDWFGQGSRIIIISRDKQLLSRNGVNKIYEVKELDNENALELFNQIAFKKHHPEKNYVDLSNDFLKYAKGLPLALEVLGSFLFGRTSKAWEDALHQLKENPKKEIFDTLEIGYKGLEHTTKKLFLDIACFFKGEDKNRVVDIFEGPGYYTNIDIEILIDRSLITMLGRKLWMHDLLQKMGWEIVRRESEELGRQSRLWIYQDIFHVLKSNSGTESIKGIMLKSFPHEECLDAKAFFGMKKLGLLKICNVQLPQGLNYLSNELRLMEWHGYPLKFMPRSFQANKLVELIMPGSRIELLPEGFTHSRSLKLIDLNGSQNLIKTPNFEGFPSLERLIFQGCTRLNEVHSSIGVLKHLTLLDLKNCKSLKSFPHEINLESLEIFVLSGCSRLKKFPEVGSNMTRLSNLYLDGTAIDELPLSIEHLTGITLLNLRDCKNLSRCPSTFCGLSSLKTLNLSGCKGQSPTLWQSLGLCLICATFVFRRYNFITQQLGEEPINLLLPKSISGLSSLVSLDLSDCNLSDTTFPDDLSFLSSLEYLNLSKNNFTHLPRCIYQLSQLKYLYLDKCSKLQSFPNPPLSTQFVMARDCTSLEKYSNHVVKWTLSETTFTIINCLSLIEDGECRTSEVSLVDIDFQPLWQIYMEERISQSKVFYHILPQTEIPEWFNHQSLESSVTIPLTSDICDDSTWKGIAIFAVFVVNNNLIDVYPCQDSEYFHEFICHFDMDGGAADCPIFFNIPKDKFSVGSFGLVLYISCSEFRGYLEKCEYITSSITTNSPSIKVRKCGAHLVYDEDILSNKVGTNMTHLSEQYLDGTAVVELPSSLKHLAGLTLLNCRVRKFLNLPSPKTFLKFLRFKDPLPHDFSSFREVISPLLPRLRFIVSLNLADNNFWDGVLPDYLGGLSSLQDMDLSKNNFTCLPDSISQLSKLKHLNLNDCSKLQSLPNLPFSVYVTARRCTSLENYSNQNFVWTSGGTRMTWSTTDGVAAGRLRRPRRWVRRAGRAVGVRRDLVYDEDILSNKVGTNMTHLLELYLDGTAVEELPSSLEHLTGLTLLNCRVRKNLNLPSLKTFQKFLRFQVPLPHDFSSSREVISPLLPRLRFIVSLNLADNNFWDGVLPDYLGGLSSLQDLDLSKNNFTCLPGSISQLSKLKHLNLNDCSKLQLLPNLPFSVYVTARRCTSLENYSNQTSCGLRAERG